MNTPKVSKSVTVCGQQVPVQHGTELNLRDLQGTYACYDTDTSIIWINKSTPKREHPFWLTHETLHALFDKAGLRHLTAAVMKVDEKDLNAWEEAVVRLLTPHVFETFGAPKVK